MLLIAGSDPRQKSSKGRRPEDLARDLAADVAGPSWRSAGESAQQGCTQTWLVCWFMTHMNTVVV